MSANALIRLENPKENAWKIGPGDLVQEFLGGLNKHTREAYQKDLQDFAHYLGISKIAQIPGVLFRHGHGPANAMVMRYRVSLLGRGLAPASVNRRLAAIRMLVQTGRMVGIIAWTLDVPNVRVQTYRDTSGPGPEGIRQLFSLLGERHDPKGLRDQAIARLLYDVALRRGELLALDLVDFDQEQGTLAILGKGRNQKERISLPDPTRRALSAWIAVRGGQPGPLFPNLDRAHKGGRLTGSALYAIVSEAGKKAGLKLRPHGLRHAAITQALDVTGGDFRTVQRFSRHRDIRTLQVYDDCRRDLGGEVAKRVAELSRGGGS